MNKREPISVRETANHGFVVEAMSSGATCTREEYVFANTLELVKFLNKHFPAPVAGEPHDAA
jgi:hypothetical protein